MSARLELAPASLCLSPSLRARRASPSYSVVPVEGRTVLDVVPPSSVAFVESLVTVRSNLDPFLRVEAMTYAPPRGDGGGAEGGGVSVGSGGSGEGGAAGVGGGGGVDGIGAGGSGGSGFLTFGLSSRSCAAVGFTFLGVGLLLLVQPMFAIRRWWREAGREGVDGTRGTGRRSGRAGGRGRGSGGSSSRHLAGQWRYGQVSDDW